MTHEPLRPLFFALVVGAVPCPRVFADHIPGIDNVQRSLIFNSATSNTWTRIDRFTNNGPGQVVLPAVEFLFLNPEEVPPGFGDVTNQNALTVQAAAFAAFPEFDFFGISWWVDGNAPQRVYTPSTTTMILNATLNPGQSLDITTVAIFQGPGCGPCNASNHAELVVGWHFREIAGACCFEEGLCLQRTGAACLAEGGTYVGDFTDCTADACGVPTGACCFDDGFCAELKEFFCVAFGGTFQGDGTSCDTEPCGSVIGACCQLDGSCTPLTQLECEAGGGEYQGPGTDCVSVVCTPGACCLLSGVCVEATAGFCAGVGGDFQGAGTACPGTSCQSFVLNEPSEFVASGEPTVGVARDAGPTASSSDLDGEGTTPDLVIVIPRDMTAQVFLNRGNDPDSGGWLGFDALPAINAGTEPTAADVGLLNAQADLTVDLAVTDRATDQVLVFLGQGDGTFAAPTGFPVGGQPSAVIARDLLPDAGNDTDLAVASEADATVTFLAGDGLGGFAGDHTVGTGGVEPLELASGDYIDDKDDCLDVAGLNREASFLPGPAPPGSVFVLSLNPGTGEFELVATTEVGANPKDLASGDLNADAITDLAVVNADDESVSVLVGVGDGTFARTDIAGVGADPRSIDAADVDGDGDLDLAVVSDTEVVKVLFNVTAVPGGPALFTDPISFIVDDNPDFEANPNGVTSADLDQDGITDLMTVNADAATGTGGSVSALVRQECEADVDGDGAVGINDACAVLDAWGCTGACPEDVTGDGIVGINDLLQVLAEWGVCP